MFVSPEEAAEGRIPSLGEGIGQQYTGVPSPVAAAAFALEERRDFSSVPETATLNARGKRKPCDSAQDGLQ